MSLTKKNTARHPTIRHLPHFTPFQQWNFILGHIGVKSVVDVGCGVGFSTTYFRDRGARVLCVEGSHDAVSNTLLPLELVVEHDFSRGAYWPEQLFDAAWCVEFTEHVGRMYQQNYFATFRRAALIFMTASPTGGWHHVEQRDSWWWIARMEMQVNAVTDKNDITEFQHRRIAE